MDAHGGQVVEDDGEGLIDQRPDHRRKLDLHPLAVIHQRVHGAKQMLVGDGFRHGGHGDGLQPAQAAQLAVRIAQAVEDHRADQRLRVDLAPTGAQGARQRPIKTEVLPKLMQGEDVAIGLRAFADDLRCGVSGATKRPIEAVDQRIEFSGREIVKPTEIGDHTMADLAVFAAIPFDELEVASPSGLGDLGIHAATLSRII